jgi:dihydrofolate reductase
LIDEVRLLTFPVVLGGGKKLFGSSGHAAAFRLTHSRISPNGIVIARYERAGQVRTGDYAMDPPTPAEVARREKLRRES